MLLSTEASADADSPVIELKTGRTSKVNRRLIEWKGQCRTNDLILRGFWPDDSSGSSGAASSLAIVDIDAGPPGPCMQIVERLVHLELADLVLHSHYLDPGFPDASKMTLNSESSGSDSGGDVSAKKGGNKSTKGATALKQLQRMSEPCIDCKYPQLQSRVPVCPFGGVLPRPGTTQHSPNVCAAINSLNGNGPLPLSHILTLWSSLFLFHS